MKKTIFKVHLFWVASSLVGSPFFFFKSEVLSISLPPQKNSLFFSLSSLRKPHFFLQDSSSPRTPFPAQFMGCNHPW